MAARLSGTRPPPEFATERPPDWLIDVRVRELPPGRLCRYRVQLWPGRAVVKSSVRALWSDMRPPVQEEFRGEPATELLGRVERAFAAPTPRNRGLIEDGMPCELRVFRREPFGAVRQSWNLAGWWGATDLPAAVELVAELHRARA